MKKYPDNWPCSRCHKSFEQHVQIGTPNEEGKENPATNNWCFSYATPTGSEVNNEEHNWCFHPIDNLSYVEEEAKKRNAIS